MAYTKQSLRDAVIRLNPNNEAVLKEAVWRMPMVCTITAARLWIDKTPESEDTAILREAITDLETVGYFKYTDSGMV